MSQRVLITAGAGGIGQAIAKAYLAAGARVHISDINPEALEAMKRQYPDLGTTVGDVSKANEVEALFRDVQTHLGGLDVLVNNAGIAGATSPVADYPVKTWMDVMNVNLTGTFLVTQHAIPMLTQSAAGSIVVMSSLAGRFGYANRVAYSTSKWGLVGFTKTLALELGPLGITANSIHPGAVDGPRVQSVLEGRAKLSGRSVQEEYDSALANQSIKHFVNADDIAALVLFLTGPHGRSISGQMFPIDGDSKAAS